MFDLYIYHILALVVVKQNGDEPPKKIPYSHLSLLHRSRPTVVTTHPSVLRQPPVSSAGVNVQLCHVEVKKGWSCILTRTWLYGVRNRKIFLYYLKTKKMDKP